MPVLRIETAIAAPLEACFDAARDVDLHLRSARGSGERIVAGRSSGLLELGESVTFEGRHFLVRFRLTSKIVEMERPIRFVDEMQTGPFARLRHEHRFEAAASGTRMIDVVDFASPLGLLGAIADRALVAPHLRRFLARRASALRSYLEKA